MPLMTPLPAGVRGLLRHNTHPGLMLDKPGFPCKPRDLTNSGLDAWISPGNHPAAVVRFVN
jgi:hypothetical protein